jgi:hypothetical protein
MKRVSLVMLMGAAMVVLMVLSAAPAFAANSPPSSGPCSTQNGSIPTVSSPSTGGGSQQGVGQPGGCSGGCSSTPKR